ncbi:flagellar basal body P-ring formation chaperone FlgA [Campylobacter cuniculorum]|uniref:flagellar basal body P-ring formation chaperone FlgA n=1 Tax=Campylobacter cuniculorum TaxID=374106 RepID=UPI0023F1C47D|nr:flagellar basal body P-ring formation chaperone FlgA [Campylobacter cuniculorum]
MNKVFLFLFILLSYAGAGNLDQIKIALAKEFTNNFPKIAIKTIDLKISSLPKDFEEYEFLRLADAKFNRSIGFGRAEFKTAKNEQKNIFFKYFIKAYLEVVKSTSAIKKGDKLEALHYKGVLIDFDKMPLNALSLEDTHNLIAKTNIRKNTILKENMFKINALIKKNDPIIGVLKDEGIDVLIELIALNSGDLNEKIRAKNKEGKVMQGIVIGKNRILLQ